MTDAVNNLPLEHLRIAVTRMQHQAAGLVELVREAGGIPLLAPTIELAWPEDTAELDRALTRIDDYDWVILTSANGVAAVLERMQELQQDSSRLFEARIAAVGTATAAAIEEAGGKVEVVPEKAVGKALAEALLETDIRGKRVLLPVADIARTELEESLGDAGVQCDRVTAYRTVMTAQLPEAFLEAWDAGQVDWVTLTSPSAFRNLCALLGEDRSKKLAETKLASIGPVTSQAIREAGLTNVFQARTHDIRGVVDAMIESEATGTNRGQA